jgi:1-phosphofructokinase
MIATVTLNPAIDQTVRVDQFTSGAVNRGQAMQFDAGGKGVNIASYLTDYGLEVAVTGFMGEENAHPFQRLFGEKGIVDRFVRIPGRTRTNVKIVDEANQTTTDINMQGQAPPAEGIDALLETIDTLAESCDWFALSGSLPPGVPDVIYGGIVDRLKSHGVKTILDTSRAALREGVPAGPTIVKPNIHELEQLVGSSLSGRDEVIAAARELLAQEIALVVVSMGKEGALFVDGERVLLAEPPAIAVKSTVGAGDAMVAGLIAAQSKGLDLAAAARLASAFAVGAITRVGAHLPPADQLKSFIRQVRVRALDPIAHGEGHHS